ncbi:hypothetical protein Bacsa_0071 [Phocaeicola salanitronis DSM 18170]|uniref:DUF115 domain-containing protein n=1 Tax=Phocaeicola salanitronis (strain DSM 18170 / JCM 13657 / CCUG 60908 / BL78) TaxID=667015 RepID=F0R4J4_PHOSB|nr:hypothetical protein [Phocaeicola salanitronis]ADY34684.1 hypothetical protein Bacsa_0071 [Phocaeicola salanitronis DSM 18170]
MKILIKQIAKFFVQSLKFTLFLLRVVWHRAYINPIKRQYHGTVAVLANGPSLKGVIPTLQTDPVFQGVDYIVMNYFAFEDIFFKIKPIHYCLADPMFFKETHRKQEAQHLFAVLQKNVDWDLNIYIPSVYLNAFKAFSHLSNPHLHIVPLNYLEYKGFERFRFFFYRKGMAIPRIETVAQMCIYVGINSGYSTVRVYGVDHNFFETLCVDENNHLCNRDTHFYDKKEVSLKPLKRNDNGKYWKVSEYIAYWGRLFESHDILADYSKYSNVTILNCTKSSFIDSYERES